MACHCRSFSSLPRSSESSIHSLTSLHDQLPQSDIPVSRGKSRSQLVDQPLHYSRVVPPTASLILQTDGSTIVWRAYCQETNLTTGGLWSGPEAPHRITLLELKAAFLTVQSFVKQDSCHILLLIDNIVAISYIKGEPTLTGYVRYRWTYGVGAWIATKHCMRRIRQGNVMSLPVQTHERQQRLAIGHSDFLSPTTNKCLSDVHQVHLYLVMNCYGCSFG